MSSLARALVIAYCLGCVSNKQDHQQQQQQQYPEWAVTSEELSQVTSLFESMDLDADGLVSGEQVFNAITSGETSLSNKTLAQIWDLVAIDNSGSLNRCVTVSVRHSNGGWRGGVTPSKAHFYYLGDVFIVMLINMNHSSHCFVVYRLCVVDLTLCVS